MNIVKSLMIYGMKNMRHIIKGKFVFILLFALILTGCGGAMSVKISSVPKGARVYVDGEYKGKTPLMLAVQWNENLFTFTENLFYPRRIRMEKEGYKTITRNFTSWHKYDGFGGRENFILEEGVGEVSEHQLNKQPEQKQVHSMATGFLLGSSGYILTNYHVVRGVKSIKVKFQNGKKVTAEVVAKDSQNDIVFLKPKSIPNIRTMNLSLADSSSVMLGDKVFTLGYPIATVLGENMKYSEGVINSLSGVGDDPKFFQISIPTQSGNSGGPLFNERGEVVGIVSSSLDVEKTQQTMGITPQNVNFAIKSSLVKNMLPMLPENLISPTDLSIVQNKSKGSISNFVQQVENNIVLIEVE